MATGAPDWQKVVTVEASLTAGAPDWERVVVGAGGVPISTSYASLTGAGETTTPGNLTQAGGFAVVGGVTGGIDLESNTHPVIIASLTTDVDIHSGNVGTFGTEDALAAVAVQTGGSVLVTCVTLAFYGGIPVPRAAAPVTLADVIAILTNLNLCA